MLKVGSVIDNKYKILSEVGHGGMSTVYLAINERANKTWAVKEVRKDGTFDFEAVKQGLIVETDMLKKFNHPHLPSIIDVIDTADSFLIVMDYIEGRSLKSVLDNGGAQDPDQVIEWGKQICDVLGYLHSRTPSIIYRDMKPSNLMLKPDGNIMLIDFGTAREFKNRAMVEDTTCLGTRGYAAPEQFGGMGETTPRTDIYCTGATLYHLLTGHSPAEPPYEIKPLSYWDPAYVGTGLEKVIAKCCQQDPDQRYQTCAELMYALENVHLEDDVAKKSRNRRWRAFLASAIVSLVALTGMFVMNAFKSGAEAKTYDHYIQRMAELTNVSEEDFVSIGDFCNKAISIEPSRAEAYNSLLDCIKEDYRLSATEKRYIDKCFHNNRLSAKENNVDALKASDRGAYDALCYELGLLYYFMSDTKSSSADRAMAKNYFAEAAESAYLSSERISLSESIVQIVTIEDGLKNSSGNQNSAYADDAESKDQKYKDLWDSLEKMVAGDVKAKVGKAQYAFYIYQKAAVMYGTHYEGFKNEAGKSLNDIKGKLEALQTELEKIEYAEGDETLRQLHDEAAGIISTLLQKVTSAQSGSSEK